VDDQGQGALRPQQIRLLERYLDLLYDENIRLNLTRVPRQRAWERHVEESLSLLSLRSWSEGELTIDLGSGGGVPGIPLAIARPHLRLLLLDRDQAKAAFLSRCLVELGLAGSAVVARDARELGRVSDRPRADVVVSRAAAPATKLLPLVVPLLKERGEALLLVGESVLIDQRLLRTCARLKLSPPELIRAGSVTVLRLRR
jgi:16S rRNA (guanine527-N7)-methyltransferase